MKAKEKQLLITDLSARVLYGVIISPADSSNAILIGCLTDGVLLQDVKTGRKYEKPWELEYIKPYLRPLSSITEEEKKELIDKFGMCQSVESGVGSSPWYNCPERDIKYLEIPFNETSKFIDWLNKHHFDYRRTEYDKTMIESGLALIAPEGMY